MRDKRKNSGPYSKVRRDASCQTKTVQDFSLFFSLFRYLLGSRYQQDTILNCVFHNNQLYTILPVCSPEIKNKLQLYKFQTCTFFYLCNADAYKIQQDSYLKLQMRELKFRLIVRVFSFSRNRFKRSCNVRISFLLLFPIVIHLSDLNEFSKPINVTFNQVEAISS